MFHVRHSWITETDLWWYFNLHGQVEAVTIPLTNRTDGSKRPRRKPTVAYLRFADKWAARAAVGNHVVATAAIVAKLAQKDIN